MQANGRELFLLCGQSLAHSGCCWVGEGWMSRGARLVKEQREHCVPSPFQTQASPPGRAFSAWARGSRAVCRAPLRNCPQHHTLLRWSRAEIPR